MKIGRNATTLSDSDKLVYYIMFSYSMQYGSLSHVLYYTYLNLFYRIQRTDSEDHMDIIKLKKGDILHEAGDIVETIEIVSKGKIRISNAYSHLELGSGSVIGLSETPGEGYLFYYEAAEDTEVYSYAYLQTEDFAYVIRDNPKVAPFLASECIRMASAVYAVFEKQYEDADQDYQQIRANYAEYSMLCTMAGKQPQIFPEVLELVPIAREEVIPDWQSSLIDALQAHQAELGKSFYPLSSDICIGFIMYVKEFISTIARESVKITDYRKSLIRSTMAFRTEFMNLQDSTAALRNDTDSEGAAKAEQIPSFDGSLDRILSYAGLSEEDREQFHKMLRSFSLTMQRSDLSDEARTIRRDLSGLFYKVYTGAFLNSLNDSHVPDELKMFFMFGFMDEDLVGHENAVSLYRFMKSWKPDLQGNVLTVYDWLVLVYNGKVEPSMNEFNLDYPAYLKEQKSIGNITAEEAAALLNDQEHWLTFEISNLFVMGNRMTFGRVSSFVPILNQSMILSPLKNELLTPDLLHLTLDHIRNADFSCFYREVVYSNPEEGINQFFYQKEILPYIILMPNVGGRAAMWQEIEGRRRNTPARMLISIFHTDDLESSLLHLCGEYRWELCKTVQGVHWNDVSDPSLTSIYTDYLQFYKKNHTLSEDQKEKVREEIKKNNNKYRDVFINDYVQYMKYEQSGSLRLNRIARTVLFTFCPFSEQIRNQLCTNPQYADLIQIRQTHTKAALHTLAGIIRKVQTQGHDIPDEMNKQLQYLQL